MQTISNIKHRLRDNEAAFDRYRLKPRVLVNVENIDLSSEIMGVKVRRSTVLHAGCSHKADVSQTMMPLGFSPAAMHRLAHPDGEIATSRAAAKYGLCMGLSTYSTSSLEDVAAQGNGNPFALQLSALRDRRTTLRMIKRAESKSEHQRRLDALTLTGNQRLDIKLYSSQSTSQC